MQAAPDITLPEVHSFGQSARFYRSGERDFVEISFVGAKDTVVQKVTPEHMARFRPEWDAYCDGKPLAQRPGTPFAVIGMNEARAESYVQRNVHNLEELAALSDMQCQGLGHGTLTDREAAKKYIAARQLKDKTDAFNAVSERAAALRSAPEAPAVPPADLTEVKEQLGELTKSVGALVALLAAQATDKPRRGRPPKASED